MDTSQTRMRRSFTPFGEELQKILDSIDITVVDLSMHVGLPRTLLSKLVLSHEYYQLPTRAVLISIIKALHEIAKSKGACLSIQQANALLFAAFPFASQLNEQWESDLISLLRKPVRVFMSYSRRDDSFREEIEKHLKVLERQDKITLWCDREILPGMEWRREIDSHLETSSLILLLVSPDFFVSDYCYGIEMQTALNRHYEKLSWVIPIIVRPVDWKVSPISELQVLPSEGKAISMWKNRDDAIFQVVQGLRKVINTIYNGQ
jgi:hypothetical protein